MPRDLSSRKSTIAATGKSSDCLPGAGKKPPPAHAPAPVLPRRGKPQEMVVLILPIANAAEGVAGNSPGEV